MTQKTNYMSIYRLTSLHEALAACRQNGIMAALAQPAICAVWRMPESDRAVMRTQKGRARRPAPTRAVTTKEARRASRTPAARDDRKQRRLRPLACDARLPSRTPSTCARPRNRGRRHTRRRYPWRCPPSTLHWRGDNEKRAMWLRVLLQHLSPRRK